MFLFSIYLQHWVRITILLFFLIIFLFFIYLLYVISTLTLHGQPMYGKP